MKNKGDEIKYYHEQIKWYRDYRTVMYITAAVVALSSAAIGLGLGMLLGNIAKGLVVAAAVGGVVETYPFAEINKCDIKLDDAETSLNNMKKRIHFERPDTYEHEKEEIKTLDITHERSNSDEKKIDKAEEEFENKYSYKYDKSKKREIYSENKSDSKKR